MQKQIFIATATDYHVQVNLHQRMHHKHNNVHHARSSLNTIIVQWSKVIQMNAKVICKGSKWPIS